MIDTNKVISIVKDTPLDKIDNEAVIIEGLQAFGFTNWQGTQNVGRWFGRLAYRTDDNRIITGQGTSTTGYTSKANALKYAVIDFEKSLKEFEKWGWQPYNTLIQLRQ